MLELLDRVRKSHWAGYLFPLPACMLAWAGHLALCHAGATNIPYLPFLLALVATSMVGGAGPGLLTIAITEAMSWGLMVQLHSPLSLSSGNLVSTVAVVTVGLIVVLLANFGTLAVIRLDHATKALRAINQALEDGMLASSAALLVAEDNLRQAQKMEAVGLLTGGIAHDFNNLLTGIMGSLELLQMRLAHASPGELARYITTARDAATRAANLTNRLLTFSRPQPLNPSGTDIGMLVTGMAELIGRTIGRSIKLDIVTCPEHPAILVDPNQLEHALLNLCINASDAMPHGGVLRISVASTSLSVEDAASLDLASGDYVTLTVTDTGTGMTPAVLSRAFDPFFTTKPAGQGTGLGLSMIYRFTRQSGGHACVTSTPGEGTSVTLYLPRHYGALAARQIERDPAAAAHSEHGEVILLVEDEPSVRLVAAEVLAEHGYVVHQADSAESAMQFLELGQHVDVLITDLGLPGTGGRAFAESVLARRPDMKILFITGYGDYTVPCDSDAPTDQILLSKPFSMSTLANRVQEMLAA